MHVELPPSTPIKGFVRFDPYYLLLENRHERLEFDQENKVDLGFVIVYPLTLGRRGIHMGYAVAINHSAKIKAGFTYLCAYRCDEVASLSLQYRLENLRIFTANDYVLLASEHSNLLRERIISE